MSTAAKTPNYNLSQVAGSDIPDWITDYTSDMSKIDDALKGNADDIDTVRPDEFSEESTYAAGDYCIKDNVIYKAKTAVEAGAFDISDWTATTIFDELSGLNQNMDVINVSNRFSLSDSSKITAFYAWKYGKLIRLQGMLTNITEIFTFTALDETVEPAASLTCKALNYSAWNNELQRLVNVNVSVGGASIAVDGESNGYQYTAVEVWYLSKK